MTESAEDKSELDKMQDELLRYKQMRKEKKEQDGEEYPFEDHLQFLADEAEEQKREAEAAEKARMESLAAAGRSDWNLQAPGSQ